MEQTLTESDRKTLEERGISEERLYEQLRFFREGFPPMEVKAYVSAEKGIRVISPVEQTSYLKAWDDYLKTDHAVCKFVPASGAASRMFKGLYEFLASDHETPVNSYEKDFFDGIDRFAFYDQLNNACWKLYDKDIHELMAEDSYKKVVSALLETGGLNYGSLPKGLLVFHRDTQGVRTAMEEHLAEGAMYAKTHTGRVQLHFTVSPEHLPLFKQQVEARQSVLEQQYGVQYDISFSTQKPSTDTVAVDLHNNLFRNEDDSLLFRPGGHGALIENLNDIDADIAFIKNVDNVVPDSYKQPTVLWKKILGGVLVTLQQRIFRYLEMIDSGKYTHEEVLEIIHFLQNDLCIKNPETKYLEDAELMLYLRKKLLRPLRVCGMVKNEGEPGGGPFFAVNPDGTVSLQILESSQINSEDPAQAAFYRGSTHFNPVDIACGLKNHRGEKYDLPEHVDKNSGFISSKSKDGRELKALELPGLWNGAMSDWNTVFVEVPIETFNPVKSVLDLLRPAHQ